MKNDEVKLALDILREIEKMTEKGRQDDIKDEYVKKAIAKLEEWLVPRNYQDVIDNLLSIMLRHCYTSDRIIDSLNIWYYADAIRTLAEFGEVEIISERNNNVKAKLVDRLEK